MAILFQPQVIFFIVLLGSAVIVIHAIMGHVKQTDGLKGRFGKLEKELRRLQKRVPENRKRIEGLKHSVKPLQSTHQRLNTYWRSLESLRMKAEQDAETLELANNRHDISRRDPELA